MNGLHKLFGCKRPPQWHPMVGLAYLVSGIVLLVTSEMLAAVYIREGGHGWVVFLFIAALIVHTYCNYRGGESIEESRH